MSHRNLGTPACLSENVHVISTALASGCDRMLASLPKRQEMKPESDDRIPLADLQFFHRLTRSLTSSFDLATILRTILEHMEHTIEADFWALLMLDEEKQELAYTIASRGEQEALRDVRIKVGEGVAGWVAQHGETLIVPEAEEDPRFNRNQGRKLRSVIALPVRGRKGTHAVIEIFNPRPERTSDSMIAFLHILADHAAIAIENSRDMSRIQQLSITDDCTGLYNARHLYDVLDRELERCTLLGLPVSLAFLDLDYFKLVNDIHGHLVGSQLLCEIGKRLEQLSRGPSGSEHNLCFRYGGDEFILLMPETGSVAAQALCGRILHALMDSPFTVKSDLHLKVSASMGLATTPADGFTVHSIIGAADSRMYAVKAAGRGHLRSG